MSTHNIQFHDTISKNHQLFVFLSYLKNFVGTEKRVRIIHGKRAIRVRAIEVILCNLTVKCPCNYIPLPQPLSATHLLEKLNSSPSGPQSSLASQMLSYSDS